MLDSAPAASACVRGYDRVQMNFLAHALLAGRDDDALLGSVLGDFWRGAPDPHWPPRVGAGVAMHRKIDVYTDSHPHVAAARALFEAPLRRYAGILLDVYFDHVLARSWPATTDEPLAALSRRVDAVLHANRAWLPPELNRFADYFRSAGLFASYAHRATIERVLAGISRRLRHANPLAQAAPALWARAAALDAHFEEFFPDLRAEAARLRRRFGLP